MSNQQQSVTSYVQEIIKLNEFSQSAVESSINIYVLYDRATSVVTGGSNKHILMYRSQTLAQLWTIRGNIVRNPMEKSNLCICLQYCKTNKWAL